jgi:hypothetical protein
MIAGEMGRSVFKYPTEYMALVSKYRGALARGKTGANVKVGLALHWNKVCGNCFNVPNAGTAAQFNASYAQVCVVDPLDPGVTWQAIRLTVRCIHSGSYSLFCGPMHDPMHAFNTKVVQCCLQQGTGVVSSDCVVPVCMICTHSQPRPTARHSCLFLSSLLTLFCNRCVNTRRPTVTTSTPSGRSTTCQHCGGCLRSWMSLASATTRPCPCR